MGIAQAAVRGFKNIWSHGDDEEYDRDERDRDDDESPEAEAPAPRSEPANKYTPQTYSHSQSKANYGGGNGAGAPRRVQTPVALPLRAREKNIYTLKPKSQEEASVAADYLKTGSAVVLNLDEVERLIAVRIIDFMSGVCYGLDNQGHAMKLGDTIFLFTPGDFEISSDEPSYSENPEFFFKDVPDPAKSGAVSTSTPSPALSDTGVTVTTFERPTEQNAPIERTALERPVIGRPAVERPTIDRPSRPWER